MSNERHCIISDKDHAANIGYIVLALADPHSERGDCDDFPIPRNHRVITIIDRREPAQHLADALADLSKEDAAGIAEQVNPRSMPTKLELQGDVYEAVRTARFSDYLPINLPAVIADIARRISALYPAMAPVAEDVAILLYDQASEGFARLSRPPSFTVAEPDEPPF